MVTSTTARQEEQQRSGLKISRPEKTYTRKELHDMGAVGVNTSHRLMIKTSSRVSFYLRNEPKDEYRFESSYIREFS